MNDWRRFQFMPPPWFEYGPYREREDRDPLVDLDRNIRYMESLKDAWKKEADEKKKKDEGKKEDRLSSFQVFVIMMCASLPLGWFTSFIFVHSIIGIQQNLQLLVK